MIKDCNERCYGDGLCNIHYQRERRAKKAAEGIPCKIEGCGSASIARGMCSMHWQRWMRGSTRLHAPRKDADPIERLLSNMTVQSDGCWQWRPTKRKGYGRIKIEGKFKTAHVYCYEHFKGPVPNGLELDHLCRNRACVNPDHLEPVTRRVNVLRGDSIMSHNAAKTHCVNGHEFSPENTIIRKNGNRGCRQCKRNQANSSNERKRKLLKLEAVFE